MSQEQLAEKIGIDPKHLSRIEVGRGYPSLKTLENISNILNIEMKDLFEFQRLDSVGSVADDFTDEEMKKKQRNTVNSISSGVTLSL